MVPTSLSAVVAFLILVAPGVPWTEKVRQHQSWRKSDSAFREIARVILWSIWGSLPATLLTGAALYVVYRPGYRDIRQWFLTDKPPNVTTLVVGIICGMVELVLAMAILEGIWWKLSTRLYGPTSTSQVSAWEQFLTKSSPADVVSAQVILSDGTSWLGEVQAFSTDNEWSDREIVLANAAHASIDPGGSPGPTRPGHLVIPSAAIVGLQVVHSNPAVSGKMTEPITSPV